MFALRVTFIVLLCGISSAFGRSYFIWDTILPVNGEQNAPQPEEYAEKVKRRAFSDDNRDRIFGLSELIGNIENGLVRSALSVGGTVSNSNPLATTNVELKTDSTASDHDLAKRLTLDVEHAKEVGPTASSSTPATVPVSKTPVTVDQISAYKLPVGIIPLLPTFTINVSKTAQNSKSDRSVESSAEQINSEVVLSTTSKLGTHQSDKATLDATVPGATSTVAAGVSSTEASGTLVVSSTEAAAVSPKVTSTENYGGIWKLPTSENLEATSKILSTVSSAPLSSSTESTITSLSSVATDQPTTVTTLKATSTIASSSTSTSTSTTTKTTTTTTTTSTPQPSTTKTPIVELKEAEEHLREKVAEIEADPVILSARV